MQARYTPHSEQSPENGTEQICSRVFDRQIVGPGCPDLCSFSIEPESCSVRVVKSVQIAPVNFPHFEYRNARLIIVRTDEAQYFGQNAPSSKRRNVQVDAHKRTCR